MISRERIIQACNHVETDKLPVDFGGGFQTGIHVSIIYKMRQHLGLDAPGTPIKVTEVYQMLGEVKEDLLESLGADVLSVSGTGTMFGFPSADFKEWEMADGTPVLVPEGFNTEYEENGELLQYPCNDRSVPASGCMPRGGYFFDATVRPSDVDENNLSVEDNLEEFGIISDSELEYYKSEVDDLYESTDKALFMSMSGLTFGDVALVPATWLKKPKGVRDIQGWYMTTALNPEFIKEVFSRQAEIAIENLQEMYKSVGDKISIIITNGTDFGTQNGPFLSTDTYRELYLTFQKKVNGWIHANTPWKTFMHCCGSIFPLLDCICEAEFDILNPVQCSAENMDPQTLKNKYGDRLTFWGGGVDTQKTLPFGTPEEVRREVAGRIEIFRKNGGFVFNQIHNIQAETPIENIMAMIETVKKYR